jgi:hypothetical protein
MRNIGRVRIFYRGLSVPQKPYYWEQYGIIAFGISIIGIMIFKK